jgi:hypothetical protein
MRQRPIRRRAARSAANDVLELNDDRDLAWVGNVERRNDRLVCAEKANALLARTYVDPRRYSIPSLRRSGRDTGQHRDDYDNDRRHEPGHHPNDSTDGREAPSGFRV